MAERTSLEAEVVEAHDVQAIERGPEEALAVLHVVKVLYCAVRNVAHAVDREARLREVRERYTSRSQLHHSQVHVVGYSGE